MYGYIYRTCSVYIVAPCIVSLYIQRLYRSELYMAHLYVQNMFCIYRVYIHVHYRPRVYIKVRRISIRTLRDVGRALHQAGATRDRNTVTALPMCPTSRSPKKVFYIYRVHVEVRTVRRALRRRVQQQAATP